MRQNATNEINETPLKQYIVNAINVTDQIISSNAYVQVQVKIHWCGDMTNINVFVFFVVIKDTILSY